MYTNINITNNSDQFKYIIEYIPSSWDKECNIDYLNGVMINDEFAEQISFTYNEQNYIKYNNHWYSVNEKPSNQFIPKISKLNTIRIYFPSFSVDTYHTGHKYALTVNTWICGKYVVLGTYIINRYDSHAVYGDKKILNDNYYECIDLPILDPLSLIYSDDWEEWRRNICGEADDKYMINTDGVILCCSLHPVIPAEVGYMKLSGYDGGQNHINFQDHNYQLVLNASTNITKSLNSNERPAISLNLQFNKYYKGSLEEYLFETYGLSGCKIKYELVIGNENDVYVLLESELLDLTDSYKFDKDKICEYNFDNGDGWKPGIYIIGSVNIVDSNNESVLYLLSNEIPFTEDILKYFIKTEFIDDKGKIINNVKLKNVNMNLININAVNKTENRIIKVDNINDNQNNIYQTVFYRVSDSTDIIIRPSINENICINLDMYKHLVKSFIIQVEGVKFAEIGRSKSGIIFKIIGGKLPKKNNSGQYYILNQDSENITAGKYTYLV